MLLYNVTLILEDAVAEEWLQWMQEIHIPEMMATGMFASQRLLKVLDSPNEGVTYCAQYVAENEEKYNQYREIHEPALHLELDKKFKNRFVIYRTLMEFIPSAS